MTPNGFTVLQLIRRQALSRCLKRFAVLYDVCQAPSSLTSLPRMTPTIWSHMRLCRLRGVFASKHAAEAWVWVWVLHDPRGWLGTAFHRVMQASARPGASADDAGWPGDLT